MTGWREAGEFVQHGNSPLSILHSQLNKAGALQLLGSNPEWCRKYGEADDDWQYTERERGGKYEDSAKSFIYLEPRTKSQEPGFSTKRVIASAALQNY